MAASEEHITCWRRPSWGWASRSWFARSCGASFLSYPPSARERAQGVKQTPNCAFVRTKKRRDRGAHAGLGLLGVVEIVPHNVSDFGVVVVVLLLLLAAARPAREPFLLQRRRRFVLVVALRGGWRAQRLPRPRRAPSGDVEGRVPEASREGSRETRARAWCCCCCGWERRRRVGGQVAAEERREHIWSLCVRWGAPAVCTAPALALLATRAPHRTPASRRHSAGYWLVQQ